MSKIAINTAAEIVKKHEPDAARVRKIIEEMNLAAQPEPEEEKAPAVKKQYVVLVSDPNGVLPESLDLVAWVLQIPESESVATTTDRIFRAVYDFNASKKGRMMPVKSVGEALEHVASKYFKEADLGEDEDAGAGGDDGQRHPGRLGRTRGRRVPAGGRGGWYEIVTQPGKRQVPATRGDDARTSQGTGATPHGRATRTLTVIVWRSILARLLLGGVLGIAFWVTVLALCEVVRG